MYSKRATSTSRRVCQLRRQTNSALSDLKKLSTVARQAICKANLPRGGGIVVTVAFPTHPLPGSGCLHPREGTPRTRACATAFDSEPLKAPLVRAQWRTGAVLRPAIRVMNAPLWWLSDRDGHVQRPQGKILLRAVASAHLLPGRDLRANHAGRRRAWRKGQ
jgi:hypothetical protein